MRTFWPISQEPEFSQIWDLSRNTANIINSHYRTNSVKINDTIFQYIQKTAFGTFSQFWGGEKISLENPALSHPTSYGYLASCQNLEKTNDTITRKCLGRRKDGRMEGRKDGQTLFHRTLLANTRGPKSPYSVEVCFCSVYSSTLWVCKKVLDNICAYNLLFFIMLQGTSSTVVQI